MTLSPDGKYIISGSGLSNKEDSAPLCIWETEKFTLKKKLPFHYKGIQMIKFSYNGKYMITIGNKEEKSICIWNFSNFTVIDSKSLKFPIIDLACERVNDLNLYFTTVSFEVVSFWRIDNHNRLEGFHLKYEDITNERENDEILTSIEVTGYHEKLNTSFVVVGTNTGAILILEKEKKVMLRKYYISKTAITRINMFKDYLVITGESPVVFSWNYSFKDIDHENIFDFFLKDKSRILFVDNNITSVDFQQNSQEVKDTFNIRV
jgi:WD40 repeat protein